VTVGARAELKGKTLKHEAHEERRIASPQGARSRRSRNTALTIAATLTRWYRIVCTMVRVLDLEVLRALRVLRVSGLSNFAGR
jgi:hypothetical protein